MITKNSEKARVLALRFRAQLTEERKKAAAQIVAKKGKTGELYIYESIGGSFFFGGLTAKDVVDKIEELKKEGVDTLNIYINSEGGDVFEAKAMYNALSRWEAKKVVHIDGIAASAASFLAMAGDEIHTAENATWMIHEAWGVVGGRAEDLRSMANILEAENESIAGIYAARTKQSLDEIKKWMSDETWMDASVALERKFTDSITKNKTSDEVENAKEYAAASTAAVRAVQQTHERIAAHPQHDVALARMSQRVLQNRASPGTKRDGQPSREKQ